MHARAAGQVLCLLAVLPAAFPDYFESAAAVAPASLLTLNTTDFAVQSVFLAVELISCLLGATITDAQQERVRVLTETLFVAWATKYPAIITPKWHYMLHTALMIEQYACAYFSSFLAARGPYCSYL
jgi:hypothetical protein